MTVRTPEYIIDAAVSASVRMMEGTYTAEDVAAYRAWITWRRIFGGDTEVSLRDAIETCDTRAAKLGIP